MAECCHVYNVFCKHCYNLKPIQQVYYTVNGVLFQWWMTWFSPYIVVELDFITFITNPLKVSYFSHNTLQKMYIGITNNFINFRFFLCHSFAFYKTKYNFIVLSFVLCLFLLFDNVAVHFYLSISISYGHLELFFCIVKLSRCV